MRREKRLEPLAEAVIAAARFAQERGAVRRGLFQGEMKQ
jgi:hypothetical protein